MKKLGFWTAYLLVIIFGALLLTEILAYLLFRDDSYAVHPLSEFEHDLTLGWKGIPGFRGKTPLTNSDIEMNEHGFRDGNREEKLKQSRERGLPRFLFIGDSCTYGYEIPVSARLGEQLAHIYNQNGREVTIFNAGIPAWGTAEECRALQELLPILDPQFVFLQYSTNDFGDSCLPYCYSDPKFRVYRPYYDVEGNLVLNEFVPKRFSLRIRGTFLEGLRLKFFVDRLEALLDDIHYSRFGVSENRRVPVDARTPDKTGLDRHVWDMGAVGYHPAFQDIYEKNKQRNLVLWKQMSDLCRARGAEFFMLIPSSGNTDSPPAEKDMVDFFGKNNIKFVNISACHGDYGDWGSVNYDGHPNFVSNFLYARCLYNSLEEKAELPDFSQSTWIEDVPKKIDFQSDDFFTYVMGGNWDKSLATVDGRRGRWLRGKARCVLKGNEQFHELAILMTGKTTGTGAGLKVSVKDTDFDLSETIAQSGHFSIRMTKFLQRPVPLLFVNVEPSNPVIIHSIEATCTDERELPAKQDDR